ncbi:MAG TPA: hypothetical protein PLF84_22645 [Bryobacteraceae bacterium]|nr:hypothetical protein [Bryobacteraceae bacterium]
MSIIELDDGLVVRTVRTPSLPEGVLAAAAALVFVGVAASFVAGIPQAIALASMIAAVAFFYARRPRKFELRIDKFKFIALGKVGDNLGDTRSVSVSDVRWLEYQEDTTGPETAHHPGGLYAVLKHRNLCLLPDMDEQQTASIIDRIEAKYPALREQWSRQSSFGKHFTSLGLNDE